MSGLPWDNPNYWTKVYQSPTKGNEVTQEEVQPKPGDDVKVEYENVQFHQRLGSGVSVLIDASRRYYDVPKDAKITVIKRIERDDFISYEQAVKLPSGSVVFYSSHTVPITVQGGKLYAETKEILPLKYNHPQEFSPRQNHPREFFVVYVHSPSRAPWTDWEESK
jgi:hypothetical protein